MGIPFTDRHGCKYDDAEGMLSLYVVKSLDQVYPEAANAVLCVLANTRQERDAARQELDTLRRLAGGKSSLEILAEATRPYREEVERLRAERQHLIKACAEGELVGRIADFCGSGDEEQIDELKTENEALRRRVEELEAHANCDPYTGLSGHQCRVCGSTLCTTHLDADSEAETQEGRS